MPHAACPAALPRRLHADSRLPRPSTLLIIRQPLRSRRAGFLTVLGNETGVFVRGTVAAFGLTALLAASQVAYDVMRVVGAVTLIGFGVRTLLDARRGTPGEGTGGVLLLLGVRMAVES